MSAFTADDLKQYKNVVAMLKRAHFEKLTGPEVLAVAYGIQWVSSLEDKLIEATKPVPAPAPQPEPKPAEKAKKK